MEGTENFYGATNASYNSKNEGIVPQSANNELPQGHIDLNSHKIHSLRPKAYSFSDNNRFTFNNLGSSAFKPFPQNHIGLHDNPFMSAPGYGQVEQLGFDPNISNQKLYPFNIQHTSHSHPPEWSGIYGNSLPAPTSSQLSNQGYNPYNIQPTSHSYLPQWSGIIGNSLQAPTSSQLYQPTEMVPSNHNNTHHLQDNNSASKSPSVCSKKNEESNLCIESELIDVEDFSPDTNINNPKEELSHLPHSSEEILPSQTQQENPSTFGSNISPKNQMDNENISFKKVFQKPQSASNNSKYIDLNDTKNFENVDSANDYELINNSQFYDVIISKPQRVLIGNGKHVINQPIIIGRNRLFTTSNENVLLFQPIYNADLSTIMNASTDDQNNFLNTIFQNERKMLEETWQKTETENTSSHDIGEMFLTAKSALEYDKFTERSTQEADNSNSSEMETRSSAKFFSKRKIKCSSL